MAPPPTSSSFLRPPPLPHHPHPRLHFRPPSASFRVSEILGGRGLCNGEVGVRKELASGSSASTTTTTSPAPSASPSTESPPPAPVDLDAFEKEMMGLTGGFPGGEVGLKDFVSKNPPPPRSKKSGSQLTPQATTTTLSAPPRTPELPLFLPGMVVLVKNPNNAYYMYCGIVQRVTDGKVAVLFEGGIWDRLITFNLDELEGREKGPPMVNPKSVVLEDLVAQLEENDDAKEDEAAKKEKEPEGATAAA